LKNHRIIKLGLILPDNSDIKDYQIKILNSLKKNKSFKIKLFKINNFQKNNTFIKNLFFLESKFYKKRTLNSNKIINFLKKYKKISYEELKSYYKKDIDLFINLSGKNISNKLIGIKKIFWEIVYGSENFQMFPVCFNDVVDEKPYSKIKIIELINRDFKLIDEGFFNIKNYAILHQEFIFEKTTVLLFKSLNLFKSYNLNYKKINKLKVINKNISFFKILKYYYKNYFLNLVNKNKYINWQILTAHKKKIFDLKYSKKNAVFNGEKITIRKNQINYDFIILDIPKSRIGAKLVDLYIKDITDKKQFEKLEVLKYSKDYYRKQGTGRPTKKDRRELDNYQDSEWFYEHIQ